MGSPASVSNADVTIEFDVGVDGRVVQACGNARFQLVDRPDRLDDEDVMFGCDRLGVRVSVWVSGQRRGRVDGKASGIVATVLQAAKPGDQGVEDMFV